MKAITQNLCKLALFFSILVPVRSLADIKEQTVQYRDQKQTLEGVLFYDDNRKDPMPAVLVVHDWMGISEDTTMRARMLAELGYVAFAADIYGKGIRPANSDEAGKLAGKFKSEPALMRSRVKAALNVLQNHALVDDARLAAIGYCFGGTVALELARSGAPVAGVVSFHGGLATKSPEDAKNIKGRVLVLHGADDPLVPDTEVAAFEDEMRKGGVDWALIEYGNAVHSFTVKRAGNDNSKGAAYNEKADRRSWQHMKLFFAEILG
ncbi:MAG: dienelactone hydrolase family protein [Deltaproteobacteria bacterium]|nr:dienelactone hydrolase family protein [Deltaproteobacteria bacterium]